MTKTPGTDVALPADLMAELATHAADAAAKEQPSVAKLSLKGGMLSIHNQTLPQKHIDVIILAAAYRNTYYPGVYDPTALVNPACFAIQDSPENMKPHENVSIPENDTCEGCPKSAWGSVGGGRKGKACKEGRRLLLIAADDAKDAASIAKAGFAVVDVPVTSVKNYSNYINVLSTAVRRPMWSVVTRLELVPDPKSQFKVTFTPTTPIADADMIYALKARTDAALQIALTPYDEAYLAGAQEEPLATRKKFT